MIPKTPQRSKIIRLNKSIDSKGIFKKFEDEDLIESARIAYYEGIPEFIMKSNSSDWVEYPLKKFIEENDDNVRNIFYLVSLLHMHHRFILYFRQSLIPKIQKNQTWKSIWNSFHMSMKH